MKNKVLIKLIVPELDTTYDVFIPVNEVIWKLTKLITKAISDLSNGGLDASKEYVLINKLTTQTYDNNAIVINTNIRNVTELILLSVKENNQSSFNQAIPVTVQESNGVQDVDNKDKEIKEVQNNDVVIANTNQ